MEENDLQTLKELDIPPYSPDAKRQAVSGAVQAFQAAQEEKQKNLQGSLEGPRLIGMFTQHIRRWIMPKHYYWMTGAAVASVAVVALSTTTTLWERNITISTIRTDKIAEADGADDGAGAAHVEFEMAAGYAVEGENAGVQIQKQKNVRRHAEMKEAPAPSVQAPLPLPHLQIPPPPNAAPEPPASAKSTAIVTAEMRSAGAPVPTKMRQVLDALSPDHAVYEGRDQFKHVAPNPLKKASEEPVSTFSIDVDTASYAFVRRTLNEGRLPQKDAVRIEEMVNYFDYDYPLPKDADTPFKPTVSVYPTPWNSDTKLLHIGIKGHDIVPEEKPRSNLVFLLDVSGSMNSPDKLPLLKNAFRMMVENLDPEDSVAIVTYAGRAGTVLEPTKVKEKQTILNALEQLRSGGSTAGAQGIRQAYALAEGNFDKDGVNRVMLATDGDFNVGITNREELKGFIERKRKSGIFLSVLGFGRGNYNDALMQALAQHGNGNAAYIDTLNEARKVLVEEASATLFPIAKDVKIQVEFNPSRVAEYRLIGYETRMLKREDFHNDKVDAGDIGSGHTVTALYEITPTGSKAQRIDDLRYGKKAPESAAADADDENDEYAFLKLRYKRPTEENSRLIKLPITGEMEHKNITRASDDIRFAASVAAFGQLLRGEATTGDFTYDDVIALAKEARGDDPFGTRNEFLSLVRLAKSAKKM